DEAVHGKSLPRASRGTACRPGSPTARALAGWIAQHDAGTASGPQLGAQGIGAGTAALRYAYQILGGTAPACEAGAQDQGQSVAQESFVLPTQPLIAGEDLTLRPVAGELHAPRTPRRAWGGRRTRARRDAERLRQLHAGRASGDARVRPLRRLFGGP